MGRGKKKDFGQKLASREEDFSAWYNDVIKKAGLADHSDVRGCMVIKPYGYGLWENLQAGLDARFKATGHENAYFPLFVPESLLQKEADHVEGFAPEVPWVTHVGEEKLEERLAIRPTSEAIIGATYAKWIQSYRDLPVLINQWCNVVRWEKRTRLFLRTSEFLWQEGHTCHRTEAEALEETLRMLGVYHDFLREEVAIPTVKGIKSEKEKFAGAVDTYTVEAMMGDGWALQSGTSHMLGQNFARAFGIKFLDEDNTEKHVWQTSWGMSTRIIGASIMVHGDEKGLKMPPRVAPVQAALVPIIFDKTKAETLEATARIAADLADAGLRVKHDDRDWLSAGFKFNEWEMRGAPVRLEIGPRDLEKGEAVIVRRDTGEKTPAPLDGLAATLSETLDEIQDSMLRAADEFAAANTRDAGDYETFKALLENERGFIRAPWDGTTETEKQIQDETKATIRCVPLEGADPPAGAKCVKSGEPATRMALFARAY